MHLGRFPTFLLTAIFHIVTPPSTLAGCGVNLDKMKTRRIEAIRGQILSKLGFTQLPSDESQPGQIPVDIVAMYNRTRDFVEEKARIKREQCADADADYYAQEIVTAYAQRESSNIPEVNIYKERKLSREVSEFFEFNLASFKLDPDAITGATLRFYQVPNAGSESGVSQQIDLHQVTTPEKEGRTPGRRFLDMRLMHTIDGGWQSFDVTSTVREWLRFPNSNLGLELTVPCPEEDNGQPTRRSSTRGVREKIDILFAGSNRLMNLAEGRGDRVSDFSEISSAVTKDLYPHLVIMMRSEAAQQQHSAKGRRRSKRALDAEYCFNKNPNESNCCLRELYIDFRKDLNWNWVHAPAGYKANFCAGACPYLWSMDTQHATILGLYKSMNPKASSSPCCVPKELNPLTIMFYNKGRFKVTQLTDMVLLSCKCS